MLRARWLGRVGYAEADALQRALHEHADDYLLLLEHPHVYTLGSSSSR
jgi:lipoate-protein ligase B